MAVGRLAGLVVRPLGAGWRHTGPVPADTLTASLPQQRQQPTRRAIAGLPFEVVVAVIAIGAWLALAPRTPDLAAQVYRVGLFSRLGMLVWDNNWYSGHYIPGYSLLYLPLAALLGVRMVGALAALASAVVFGRIARVGYGAGGTAAAIWFALAAAGDLWIGRLTFALGVSFALGAVLALMRSPGGTGRPGRPALALAALLAACSAASSPVAGLLLAMAAFTHVIARRRLLPGAVPIAAVRVVVLPREGLFPDGGYEPYPFLSFVASTAVALAFLWALPRGQRLLAVGGWIFVAANCLALVHTPMGSNIARYAVLLAGPLLLCTLADERAGEEEQAVAASAGPQRIARLLWPGRRPHVLVAAVLVGFAFWVAWGPVTQTEVVMGDRSTQPAFYAPLRRFLAGHEHGPVRIEVPFTRSHWAAALLAPYVELAGGWERQLAKRYNRSIEADPLAPAVYRAWLDRNAVSYVALPDVPLDGSARGEARLIEQHPPFLEEVLRSARWQVYRVLGARPLAQGPGRLTGMSHDGFRLRARSSGRFLVRVHYTPYWDVVAGSASVSRGQGGWTLVSAHAPGVVAVRAVFSLQGVLGLL